MAEHAPSSPHRDLDDPEEIADLTARQFRGIYRDNIGRDEYVDQSSAVGHGAQETRSACRKGGR